MKLPCLRSVRRRALSGLALATLLLAACSAPEPIHTELSDARPPDGLLTNPVLQKVVDLQVRRDGAGLIQDLSSPRVDVRARAAFALGSVQDSSAVPALIHALRDTSAAVRRDAAFALGQAGDTAALAPLVAAYGVEKSPEVRHRLLEAMGELPAARAPKAILGLRVPKDEEADRALALARLGAARGFITQNSLTWLLDHLTDPDPAVRRNAAYFIARVRTSAVWVNRDALIRHALASYGKDDPAAMFLLEGMGRHADLPDSRLIQQWATTATDWRIRASAMASLHAWYLHGGTFKVLMGGLDDPNEQVAISAAESLSRRPARPQEIGEIENWIDRHPGRPDVTARLLRVLARDGDKSFVFRWVDAATHRDVTHRKVGIQAMADIFGPEAFHRLEKAASSSNRAVAADAAIALARRWNTGNRDRGAASTYFSLFSTALRLDSPAATSPVAQVMADSEFVARGSIDTLVAAYRRMSAPVDLEAMTDVLSALGKTGDSAAEPLLRQALTDPQPAIRSEAAAALTRLTGTVVAPGPGPAVAPPPADTAGLVIPDPSHIDWGYLAKLGDAPRLVLDTNRGTVVVRLDTDEAPQTVQTVARLTQAGKYDGVPFHRVVPDFVVQGGDFTNHDGSGSPGFTIDSEFTEIPFMRGVIGMARIAGHKDTEGSQFFITYSMQPHLDGAYTAFGWVVKGMSVVDRLVPGDTLIHASIERGG